MKKQHVLATMLYSLYRKGGNQHATPTDPPDSPASGLDNTSQHAAYRRPRSCLSSRLDSPGIPLAPGCSGGGHRPLRGWRGVLVGAAPPSSGATASLPGTADRSRPAATAVGSVSSAPTHQPAAGTAGS